MEISAHLDSIRRDGALLATAAEKAGLDAPVPSCPDWVVRDLVRHQGDVHRWAAANLVRNRDDPTTDEEDKAIFESWPADDGGLLDWFREGHELLVTTLESAPDDVVAFTFLPAPSPKAFWARRQAHETGIHRVDAELAAGGTVSDFPPAHAADGIDEMLRGFASRSKRVATDEQRIVLIRCTDTDATWRLDLGPGGLAVTDGVEPAQCELAGTASDLYLFVWNRADVGRLDVSGDPSLASLWADKVHVRWG